MTARLKTIGVYATPSEAHLNRIFLEQEGIPVVIENENLPNVEGQSWPAAGVQILIRAEDVERAGCLLGRFISWSPSRVERCDGVTTVRVFPNRMELDAAAGLVVVRFVEIARWSWPVRFRRAMATLGWWPTWLPIGERDGFHAPRDRFFRLFTDPPIVVFCRDELEDLPHGGTLFVRIQRVMSEGGFDTLDLGRTTLGILNHLP